MEQQQGRGQKPSKAQVRFAVRQKRSDTKRALKDFLLYGKSSKHYSQDDGFNWSAEETDRQDAKAKNSSHGSKSSGKSNPNSSTHSGRGKHKTWRRKQQFYDIDDDGLNPENIFTATFGGQKCYTWSFTWTENLNFNNTWRGFDFGGESKKEKAREKFWNESDFDEDEEPTRDVGCHAHRVTLGLPTTGPLKLDDIKNAFRTSALKWHPDKHQGPSQDMAAEKFKLCVNAYNSLCSALKAS
ncbi:uncharacterized protein LOC109836573 isoform X2 [Asparagus officinalis]|uniref:uncharacterized protein LOC109836573 isoform X2 n=1 Tax=Asparagus officinalis TaxID=4686 RepID=UPI00098E0290|nr:uncharacterized protein LOC109836573 isoform X2 [Asparagus officinalis]